MPKVYLVILKREPLVNQASVSLSLHPQGHWVVWRDGRRYGRRHYNDTCQSGKGEMAIGTQTQS